jgi:hypothetical protein
MRLKIPIQIIELEEQNFHIAIQCKFYTESVGIWVIDTGASKSVFDKTLVDFYKDSGIEEEIHSAGISDQPMKTIITVLKPFYIGTFKIKNMKVALLDLTHINSLYKNAMNMEICGLIGSDFLLKHSAVIDYKKKRLTLKI